jgi:tetratricopeptide (TPR) repeat protein
MSTRFGRKGGGERSISLSAVLVLLFCWSDASAVQSTVGAGLNAELISEEQSSRTVIPPDLDDSLRESREALATRNLLPHETDEREHARLEEYQQRLSISRQQRARQQFGHAREMLVGLLEEPAPVEIQRSAVLELALLAQDTGELTRAQQIFTQYVRKYREHPTIAEVLLRQGLLYRQMGAPVMALSKFYGVLSAALHLKPEWQEYYMRLVLQAQAEIADTYYLQGKHEEASDFFARLLKLEDPNLNRTEVHHKLILSLAALGRHLELIAESELFLGRYPGAEGVSEVRFLLADSLKQLGRNRESTEQVLLLLQGEHLQAERTPQDWRYWQHKAGNKIANDLYESGDYINALEIYLALAKISSAPDWQLPSWYQAALTFERLRQPTKAIELYARMLEHQPRSEASATSVSMEVILGMARWRKDHLQWHGEAEKAARDLALP